MDRRIRLSMAVLVLAALACSTLVTGMNQVVGSGHVAGEPRSVASFTSVELEGSADVNILLGDSQSVNVEADDNILPLIKTTVVNGRLIINTAPNVNFTSTNRVVVTVVMSRLERVSLSGSGNINVGQMSGPDLTVDLNGSGKVSVEGAADHVNISLPGSGTVDCSGLKSKEAKVTVAGSGSVTVFASESLDASIAGSGSIRYEGSPAKVTKSITGSGSITP